MKITTLMLALFMLVGCSTTKHSNMTNLRHLQGTVWFQNAAEVRALAIQAFNIAKLRLNNDIQYVQSEKKRAIIVDIDETVLTNSPYQATAIRTNGGYPTGWPEWIDRADAKAIPGAVEFLKWTDSQGVEIFYVSNRKQRGFDATLKNLKAVGFPVKKENIFLRTKTRSKIVRRAKVRENYRVVVLMGDNLSDFDSVFDGETTKHRNDAVDKASVKFGKSFIVLPNPMYGDWEAPLYKGNMRASGEEKTSFQIERLQGIGQ